MILPLLLLADEPVHRDMLSCYEGERASAYALIALGSAGVATGSALVPRNEDFARGLGWSTLSLGALELVGAIGYGYAVNDEIARYESLLARDPAGFKREESAHIAGTRSRFFYYRL